MFSEFPSFKLFFTEMSEKKLEQCDVHVWDCGKDRYFVNKENLTGLGQSSKEPSGESTLEDRTNQASLGQSSWEPRTIVKKYESVSPFMESAILLEYMSQYGINKVRGGVLSHEVLLEDDLIMIDAQTKQATNKCDMCGSDQHTSLKCTTEVKMGIVCEEVFEDLKRAHITIGFHLDEDSLILTVPFSRSIWKVADHLHFLGFRVDKMMEEWTHTFKNDNERTIRLVVEMLGKKMYLKLVHLLSLIK